MKVHKRDRWNKSQQKSAYSGLWWYPSPLSRGRGWPAQLFHMAQRLTQLISRSCWWSVICYLTQNKSPQPVEGTNRGLDIWKVTCLQAAEHPVDIGMCGLCGTGRTFIQLACKGMMLRRITEHPTVVTLHWDLFFFPAFWFIHANMSKHQAQSPERKQEREGGGRWGGGGRGELEHLCDTEQQVRVKQMERRRKRSVCFSSQSFNFLLDEPSTAAKGRSR